MSNLIVRIIYYMCVVLGHPNVSWSAEAVKAFQEDWANQHVYGLVVGTSDAHPPYRELSLFMFYDSPLPPSPTASNTHHHQDYVQL